MRISRLILLNIKILYNIVVVNMSSGYKRAGIFTKLLHLTSCASLVNLLILPKITSWEIDRETVETVSDFIFLGSKITADGDCSHEIKRRLLLGRNVMTNIDSILKRRDITLPRKVCLFKAMVFPMVMYGCESWTVKRTES